MFCQLLTELLHRERKFQVNGCQTVEAKASLPSPDLVKAKATFFVLEVSLRTRTVLEDSIPSSQLLAIFVTH